MGASLLTAMNRFDRKFGKDLIASLPTTPAVYLFMDTDGIVLYVGKSKNIRRRLGSYRNASRRKMHRKMRLLVQAAATLEVRPLPSERDALLLENTLIRRWRPRFNDEGTWTFLYPAIGAGVHCNQVLLCFTTEVSAWPGLDLQWFGVFRSRLQTRTAFEALLYLLGQIGHQERSAHLPPHKRRRGSRLVGFRRIPNETLSAIRPFLAGEPRDVLVPLMQQLLEKPAARHDAEVVEARLQALLRFHDRHLVPLRNALQAVGMAGSFIAQEDRDALFLETDARWEDGEGS